MLGLLVTLILLGIAWTVVCAFVEDPEVRRAVVGAVAHVVAWGVFFLLLAVLPERWSLWMFLVLIACGIITLLVSAGLDYFGAARSISVGRGRWRLIAWGQLRLSPRVHMVLAMAIALGLTLGGWELLRRGYLNVPLLLLIIWALVPSIGMVVAIAGMRRAWREGERHRWPERWSEAPPEAVTGLVIRPPETPSRQGGSPR
jgi:hypothetical protein